MTPSQVRIVAVFAAMLARCTAIAAPRAGADEAPPASPAPVTQSQAIEGEKKEAEAAADKAKVLGPAQNQAAGSGPARAAARVFVPAAAGVRADDRPPTAIPTRAHWSA